MQNSENVIVKLYDQEQKSRLRYITYIETTEKWIFTLRHMLVY